MSYVDGFLLPIPKKKLAQYRSIARRAGRIWMKHGALQYVETVGDDLTHDRVVSFNRRSAVKPGEVPVFSWILYKARAHRNRVNALVMKDPAMLKMMAEMKATPQPFDMKRMAYGGFKTLVDMEIR
jgi:uncharacterized protein YbaA (DUF1428 family)